MYNQIAIQPQNIKSCNQSPTHHPVGVGLHAQPGLSGHLTLIVQELYDFSRNKLQQKVSQRFLVNRGVLYDILKV